MSIKFVSQQQPRGTSLDKPCKIYIHIKAKNMQVPHHRLESLILPQCGEQGQSSSDWHPGLTVHTFFFTTPEPCQAALKETQSDGMSSLCWTASRPADGSNASMNNAAVCAAYLRFPVLIIEQSLL